MESRLFRLAGFISQLGDFTGFLTPIFFFGDSFWIQDIRVDGHISNFIRSTASSDMLLNHSLLSFRVGDCALFAFRLKGDIIYGDIAYITEKLKVILKTIIGMPFLRMEVCDFLNREEDYSEAIENARKVLSNISPKIADTWHRLIIIDKSKSFLKRNILKPEIGNESARFNDQNQTFQVILNKNFRKVINSLYEMPFSIVDSFHFSLSEALKFIAFTKPAELLDKVYSPQQISLSGFNKYLDKWGCNETYRIVISRYIDQQDTNLNTHLTIYFRFTPKVGFNIPLISVFIVNSEDEIIAQTSVNSLGSAEFNFYNKIEITNHDLRVFMALSDKQLI